MKVYSSIYVHTISYKYIYENDLHNYISYSIPKKPYIKGKHWIITTITLVDNYHVIVITQYEYDIFVINMSPRQGQGQVLITKILYDTKFWREKILANCKRITNIFLSKIFSFKTL